MDASYNLPEGVKVEWKFTYYHEDGDIVDTITVSGPRAPLGYPLVDRLHTTGDSERIVLPKCGEGRVTHRTDLILTAAKKGLTASVTKPLEKVPQGIEQIIAYAWEKCSK